MSIIHHHFWLNNKESADFFTLQSGDRILLQDDQCFMEANEDGIVNPLTFGSPMVWLDATDASTINETTNQVNSWVSKDLNGLSYDATGTERPATNTNTINGLNTVTFDGVNDVLELLKSTQLETETYTNDGDMTIVAIAKRGPTDSGLSLYFSHRSSLATNGNNSGTALGFFVANQIRAWHSGSVLSTGQVNANEEFSLISRGISGSMLLNGVLDNTNNFGVQRQGIISRSVLGCGVGSAGNTGSLVQFFEGDIGEIILYGKRLTDQEVNSLYNDYILPKWGL